MRKYRPFLTYNPRKGWAYYPNRMSSPYTSKSLGSPRSRKVMREQVGWFPTAELASHFERAYHYAC